MINARDVIFPSRIATELFRENGSVDLGIEESIRALMSLDPTCDNAYSRARPPLVRVLRFYSHARCMGLDLQNVGDTYVYGSLFIWLWYFRWADGFPSRVLDHITQIVGGILIHVAKKRGRTSRSEFAFLTLWNSSIEWALPWRSELLADEKFHLSLIELLEIPSEKALKIFSGLGDGGTIWEEKDAPPDNDNPLAQIGIPQLYFDYVIRSQTQQLFEELMEFASA